MYSQCECTNEMDIVLCAVRYVHGELFAETEKVSWVKYRSFMMDYDKVVKSLRDMRDGNVRRMLLRAYERDYLVSAKMERDVFYDMVKSYKDVVERVLLACNNNGQSKKRKIEIIDLTEEEEAAVDAALSPDENNFLSEEDFLALANLCDDGDCDCDVEEEVLLEEDITNE